MGFDITRFKEEVDEELICHICFGVLEDPLQTPICEHAFCKACINGWLSRNISCPIDREVITPYELKPAARILRKLLSRLLIICDYANFGCTAVVTLEELQNHQRGCEYNPHRPLVPKNESENRNVFAVEMKRLFDTTMSKIANIRLKVERQLDEQEVELKSRLKDTWYAMETKTWSDSLRRARIENWGAMLLNPESALQATVRRAITESGCPSHLTDALMENARESRWPSGFRENRRCIKNYVCKRIPRSQAVVVLAADNDYMSDDMVSFPGFVAIFTHGIE
ncbi:unnamed protein product [Larinioides sclopetarius]|uniref:E3 ubiquitin-protein ligase NRDP1 n=1 Tax=Larinioides sclopetarius TaxID=280406 RepID=A0AAV2AGX8_9ARAC